MTTTPNQSAAAYHYDTSAAGIAATRRSASIIVPILMDLVRPASVVDVGCGLGDWLAEFKRQGCPRILGIDGAWVPQSHLQIPPEHFQSHHLDRPLPSLGRFDLATSFEVAEHLTAPAAKDLVRFLTATSDIVAFSAAIPHQGGYMHINEQWQSCWVAQFAERGFGAYDVIRPRIWADEDCCWWYRQNLLVLTTDAAATRLGLDKRPFVADVVHPRLHEWHTNPRNWSCRTMVQMFAEKLRRKLGFST